MSIKDRISAKLKSKLDLKRTLTKEENAELIKFLNTELDYATETSRAIKLIQETDDSELLDSIFTKLENTFKHGESGENRQAALEVVYLLKDKTLMQKFEDYSIRSVVSKHFTYEVNEVIADVVFTDDRGLIKKVMEALPTEKEQNVIELIKFLSEKFVDIAIVQFSKPKYDYYLPLIAFLNTKYLSEEQSDLIINSITLSGIAGHIWQNGSFLTGVDYPILPKLVKKLVEIDYKIDTKNIPLDFLVLLILESENLNDLENNYEYKYGQLFIPDARKSFIDSVYYVGMAMREKIEIAQKFVKLGFSIK